MIITLFFVKLSLLSDFFHGIITVTLSLLFIYRIFKDRLLFTPFLFPLLYMLFFGFYELKLRINMTEMDSFSKFIIIICMFFWLTITSLNKYVYRQSEIISSDYYFDRKSFTQLIYSLFLLSASMMIYEWIRAGGIPVLRDDVEMFRMTVSQSGITHTFAIMMKVLAVLVISFWFSRKGKKRGFLLSLVVFLSLLFMYGTGNRGELLFIPVVSFLVYSVLFKPNRKLLISGGIFVVFIIAIFPIIRGISMYGDSYLDNYARISRFPKYSFLMPLYDSLAFNFEILNRLFFTFPDIVSWGLGHYTFFVYIPFIGRGETLSQLQNRVWNNNFYGGLTSTFLGTWYADFGYIGCIIGSLLLCYICNRLYKQLIQRRDYCHLVLYSYTFYMVLIGTYSNAFNFVFICYYFLIWFVLKISVKKRRLN